AVFIVRLRLLSLLLRLVLVDLLPALVSFFPAFFLTLIFTLSLHDALPISEAKKLKITLVKSAIGRVKDHKACARGLGLRRTNHTDRKSTRLNSSHVSISYAVFCLKKKQRILEGRKIYQYQSGQPDKANAEI